MLDLTTFDMLALHPLLADLPAAWLRRLTAHARPVDHGRGQRLFRADAPTELVWLVHSGHVLLDLPVPGRGDVVVDRCEEFVGWAALVRARRWNFGGVVGDDLYAVEFHAAGLRDQLADDPDLRCELYARLLTVADAGLLATRHRLPLP
ncbi:cyclic nucleotide-binding domain-containing protein [Actinoplanes philippinensis]|uniref:cyclic nucleotide-binding domain-containing protein n=1 Tax=Actinoplanes philippinensis TaxID=35752 RepID=UPI0033F4CF18